MTKILNSLHLDVRNAVQVPGAGGDVTGLAGPRPEEEAGQAQRLFFNDGNYKHSAGRNWLLRYCGRGRAFLACFARANDGSSVGS